METIVNNNKVGDVNMIKEQIRKNKETIKDMLGEAAYRNFLVLEKQFGFDKAISIFAVKYEDQFKVTSEDEKEEDDKDAAIVNSNNTKKNMIDAIAKTCTMSKSKDNNFPTNRVINIAYVMYQNNENSEVGHESNKAHIYQMVQDHQKADVLKLAGFESGTRKYVSPLKRSKMQLIQGWSKERTEMEVIHTSNKLISVVTEEISGCDFNDPDNIKAIYEDIDSLHRTSIELGIDACKKFYKVTKCFEFKKGCFVRLASMMPIISNAQDFLNDLNDFRNGELNAEDFKYEIGHEHVDKIEDITKAPIIVKPNPYAKGNMHIIPDKMYELQEVVKEEYEDAVNKVFKIIYGNAKLDDYTKSILNNYVDSKEINDIVEIVREAYSTISREYVQKLNWLPENDNNIETLKSILSTQYKKALGEATNFCLLLLKDKEPEDACHIIKAAALSISKGFGKNRINSIDVNKSSSMTYSMFPQYELLLNLLREKANGHNVLTGIRIHGKGCRFLNEGDELEFRNGIVVNSKYDVIAELMANKNDLKDIENEEDFGVDHRLIDGKLKYHKDADGKHWAVKTMEKEDIELPSYDDSKLFVRVRRTYDLDDPCTRGRFDTYEFLDNGYEIANNIISDHEDLEVELVSKHYIEKDDRYIYNAIVGYYENEAGQTVETVLGSYACETNVAQKLYDGAVGKIIYSKYVHIVQDDTNDTEREGLYFVMKVEDRKDSVDILDEDSNKGINSLLDTFKNMEFGSINTNKSVSKTKDTKSNNAKLKTDSDFAGSLDSLEIKDIKEVKNNSGNDAVKEEPNEKSSLEDLMKYTKEELKMIAEKLNIKKYKSLNKEPLAKLILEVKNEQYVEEQPEVKDGQFKKTQSKNTDETTKKGLTEFNMNELNNFFQNL